MRNNDKSDGIKMSKDFREIITFLVIAALLVSMAIACYWVGREDSCTASEEPKIKMDEVLENTESDSFIASLAALYVKEFIELKEEVKDLKETIAQMERQIEILEDKLNSQEVNEVDSGNGEEEINN